MDTINGEESSSKKKLIVPIIALMLCAVAVLGAGYAYTSSVAVENNSVDGGNISVDVSEGTKFLEDTVADVVFTQEKKYTAAQDGTVTDKNETVIKAQGYGDKPIGTAEDGKVYSKLGDAKITITGKGVGAKVSLNVKVSLTGGDTAFGTTTTKFSDIVEKMVFYDAADNSKAFEVVPSAAGALGEAKTLDITDGVNLDKTYTVYLIIKDTTLTPSSSPSGDSPAEYVEDLKNVKFTVEFTVSNVTA